MTEVALAPDSSPQPPEVIVQLLEKLGLAFQVRLEHPGLSAAQRVQSVLLEDAVGALLVLFPRSQLLDLNRLAELTGRKLVAVKPERLERMLGKNGLGVIRKTFGVVLLAIAVKLFAANVKGLFA